MTDFISTSHPGGEDIPLEYGGKDATDFWTKMHGHVKNDILEDLASGVGNNTGLDTLPKLVGLTAEPPPPEALGEAGRERYISHNWTGNTKFIVYRETKHHSLSVTNRSLHSNSICLGKFYCHLHHLSRKHYCHTGKKKSLLSTEKQNILHFQLQIGRYIPIV
jgi:hypothetical protein